MLQGATQLYEKNQRKQVLCTSCYNLGFWFQYGYSVELEFLMELLLNSKGQSI